MTTRFYRSPPDLERRHWWRYRKMVIYPIVALSIALWPAKPVTHLETGKASHIIVRGNMTSCWEPPSGELERFCITNTVERR